uniref:Chemokine interleukin-8-like domain-containing protein n=1 Tax=Propithecus coquereli TaxID=379532 RepID=A0A2K6GPG2_PROCO
MKFCVTALSLLVLAAAFCSPALSAPMGSDPPTACCFSYTLRKLPRNFVMDYFETSSLCSKPAVVSRESGFSTSPGRIGGRCLPQAR